MSINSFEDILNQSKLENTPQRLLFLFAKSEVTYQNHKTGHKSGSISPVMCVDKLPEELNSLEELMKEADTYSKDWDFVFVGSLPGQDQKVPSSEDADPYLQKMSNDLMQGKSMDQYVLFDRLERIVTLGN